MAKIYYRIYKEQIEAGLITVYQAIELAHTEVPAKWRVTVENLLRENLISE